MDLFGKQERGAVNNLQNLKNEGTQINSKGEEVSATYYEAERDAEESGGPSNYNAAPEDK